MVMSELYKSKLHYINLLWICCTSYAAGWTTIYIGVWANFSKEGTEPPLPEKIFQQPAKKLQTLHLAGWHKSISSFNKYYTIITPVTTNRRNLVMSKIHYTRFPVTSS